MKTYQILFDALMLNFVAFTLLSAVGYLLVGVPSLMLSLLLPMGLALGYTRVPFEVMVLPGRWAEFRSFRGRVVVPAGEIFAIDSRFYRAGLVELRHRAGTIHLSRMMDDFPELISGLVAMNPDVKVSPLV
jgi:hypothetical protein